jgi:hypothetical protein
MLCCQVVLQMYQSVLHTTAGLIKEWVDLMGAANVAALVTDNASNMVKARALLVSMCGYEHIIPIRCSDCG